MLGIAMVFCATPVAAGAIQRSAFEKQGNPIVYTERIGKGKLSICKNAAGIDQELLEVFRKDAKAGQKIIVTLVSGVPPKDAIVSSAHEIIPTTPIEYTVEWEVDGAW